MQRWRVPLGFACAALFFIFARPQRDDADGGRHRRFAGPCAARLGDRSSKKERALATTGPYAYTRNPLYLGSFLMGVGFTIASGRWFLGFVFAALFLGIYVPVMRVESATLAELFGESYQKYAQAVPLFLPRLSRYRASKQGREFRPGVVPAVSGASRGHRPGFGLDTVSAQSLLFELGVRRPDSNEKVFIYCRVRVFVPRPDVTNTRTGARSSTTPIRERRRTPISGRIQAQLCSAELMWVSSALAQIRRRPGPTEPPMLSS